MGRSWAISTSRAWRLSVLDTPAASRSDGTRWDTEPAPSAAVAWLLVGTRPTRRGICPGRPQQPSLPARLSVTGVIGIIVGVVLLTALALIGFGSDGTLFASVFGPNDTNTPPPATTSVAQVAPPLTPTTATSEPTDIPARQGTTSPPPKRRSRPQPERLQPRTFLRAWPGRP